MRGETHPCRWHRRAFRAKSLDEMERQNGKMEIVSKHGMSEGWISLGRTRSASAVGKFNAAICLSKSRPAFLCKVLSTSEGREVYYDWLQRKTGSVEMNGLGSDIASFQYKRHDED